MPYKSKAQRAYMHAKHPKIAARWDKEYPASARSKKLPKHVSKKKKRKKKK